MKQYENNCVGCPPEKGCLGDSCPYRHELHLICDKCEGDVDELYRYDGQELCQDCLLDLIPTVEV